MAALRYSLQMGHRRCESISRRGPNSLGQSEGSVMSKSIGVRMEVVDGRESDDGNNDQIPSEFIRSVCGP